MPLCSAHAKMSEVVMGHIVRSGASLWHSVSFLLHSIILPAPSDVRSAQWEWSPSHLDIYWALDT